MGNTLSYRSVPFVYYVICMSWCLDFGFCLRDMPGGTVMIYECLLPLNQFILSVKKFQYSRLSHDYYRDSWHHSIVYVIKLNLLLLTFERKRWKKRQSSLKHFCSKSWLCFTNNSSSFCYSYIAAEVNKKTLTAWFFLSC